jgi:hypothetical protein
MKSNRSNAFFRFVFTTVFIIFSILLVSHSQDKKSSSIPVKSTENMKENENCFKCHGNNHYTLSDSATGKKIKKRMYEVISPAMFYSSNHKNFKCIDCHSDEFSTFPHPMTLRFEETPTCLDCHADDEKYAKFHFEKINEQFLKSVHPVKHGKDFTCWMCHDPHLYKINARNQTQDIEKTIAYDNAICLSCHADANIDKYQMILNKSNPNILKKHEWLPNQQSHFRQVRCIECHTEINNNVLVSHSILPKGKAVKRCVECHSSNSILMQSLYKYRSKEKLNQGGFFNAVILNDAYVIGANRNYYLNLISIILFVITIAGIAFHTFLRLFPVIKTK